MFPDLIKWDTLPGRLCISCPWRTMFRPGATVLGMSLVGGGGVSIALLASIWASNFPESLGSSVNMLKSGWSKGKVRLLWWAIVGMSALAAAIGFAIVSNSSMFSGALVEAFAAGALLTMIADEMAPEAYERSAIYAGLATVAGFALAVFLTSQAQTLIPYQPCSNARPRAFFLSHKLAFLVSGLPEDGSTSSWGNGFSSCNTREN